MNDFPDNLALVQIHVGDGYATTWGWNRFDFYVPGTQYTPTAIWDGMIEHVGSYSNVTQQYNYYRDNGLFARMESETDVTIDMVGEQVSGSTWDITATVCIEPGGTSKTVRLYMVQVLDNYPSTPSYSRNCFRLAASTADLVLSAGECAEVTRTFTFGAVDWSNQDDIKIIAWAQDPIAPAPTGTAEVHQAAVMGWPFPAPPGECGDLDSDGDVDLGDFATFAVCYYGSAVTIPPPGCSPDEFADADCDGDGDVDLGDFATFALNYTGAQ
ncbi:MAG: hypothetical protein JSU68_00315 [Phycisphaerales bacterium]|nr:MAG: hypothetical protein JSU68_00315 [Phycisphaerales bacterium]